MFSSEVEAEIKTEIKAEIKTKMSIKTNQTNQTNSKKQIEKISYGIACWRKSGARQSLLVVKKRITYSFNQFIHMQFDIYNDMKIIELLCGMTVEEKLDIMSLNFAQIWYRVWGSTLPTFKYCRGKELFERAFLIDDGARLRCLIKKATHADTLWEIPKGRMERGDASPVFCAMREFHEETGIDKSQYTILPTNPIKFSYIDNKIRYTFIYYIAIAKPHVRAKIVIDTKTEISDAKWASIDEIRALNMDLRLAYIATQVFKRCKRFSGPQLCSFVCKDIVA